MTHRFSRSPLKKHKAILRTLRGLGLDEPLVRRWISLCYPAQIERVLTDFAGLDITRMAHLGIGGARGLRRPERPAAWVAGSPLPLPVYAPTEEELLALIAESD